MLYEVITPAGRRLPGGGAATVRLGPGGGARRGGVFLRPHLHLPEPRPVPGPSGEP